MEGFYPDSWVSRNSYMDRSNMEKYISSMYWTIQTVTTVGYGDVGAVTNSEKMLSIVVMICGVTMYSFAIGNFSSVLSSANSRDEQLKVKLIYIYIYIRDN